MNYIDISQPSQTLSVNLNTSESTGTIVTESENLVSNGDFSNGSTDWTLGTGWSVGSGVAISDGVDVAFLLQSLSNIVVNDTLKVTYTVSDYVSGSVFVGFGSGLKQPSGTNRNANGTYTEYLIKEGTSVSFGFKTNSFIGSIDNVSVKVITEESNNVSINLSIYADGSDSLILNFDSSITAHNYYQTIEINSTELTQLKDETQYNIVGVDSNNKVIYRGKFQTTSKDITNYSINENKYTQKINSNNYTILD